MKGYNDYLQEFKEYCHDIIKRTAEQEEMTSVKSVRKNPRVFKAINDEALTEANRLANEAKFNPFIDLNKLSEDLQSVMRECVQSYFKM